MDKGFAGNHPGGGGFYRREIGRVGAAINHRYLVARITGAKDGQHMFAPPFHDSDAEKRNFRVEICVADVP